MSYILGTACLHLDVSTSCLPRARPACPALQDSMSCSAQDLALPWSPLAPRSAHHPMLVMVLLTGTVHQHPRPWGFIIYKIITLRKTKFHFSAQLCCLQPQPHHHLNNMHLWQCQGLVQQLVKVTVTLQRSP